MSDGRREEVSTVTSFPRRMIGVAKLDVQIYEEVEADRHATGQALAVVLLSSLAAGSGAATLGTGVISTIFAAVLSWVIWAFLTYFIGTRLLPESQTPRRHGPADANPGIRPGARCTSYLRRPARYRSDRTQRRLGVDAHRHGDCRASSAGFHDHVARGGRLSCRVAGRHHFGSSAPQLDGISSRRLAGHRRFTRWALTDNMETLSPKALAFLNKVSGGGV